MFLVHFAERLLDELKKLYIKSTYKFDITKFICAHSFHITASHYVAVFFLHIGQTLI